MSKGNYLDRYDTATRTKHWTMAVLFILAGLSGLAFFHPAFFFLTNLFGGGSWTRILHPFLGVGAFAVFALIYVKLKDHNRFEPVDREWIAKSSEMLKGNKAAMPPVGRYNAGQKFVFWSMAGGLLVLLVTGITFWQPYFRGFFPIEVIRFAVVLHALSAVVVILSLIMHVYATIWVKGTLRAMTRGNVSEGWAKQNHPLWHKEVTGKGQ
ncbi:MAG: formate dehydrogenase subunit gamma [Limnobacter sp.]|uniref:formate dehydrogenase subunit gamma n=1 Tax=Limnobacter sp. TaxID=2003368 RepID=UPI00391AC0E6